MPWTSPPFRSSSGTAFAFQRDGSVDVPLGYLPESVTEKRLSAMTDSGALTVSDCTTGATEGVSRSGGCSEGAPDTGARSGNHVLKLGLTEISAAGIAAAEAIHAPAGTLRRNGALVFFSSAGGGVDNGGRFRVPTGDPRAYSTSFGPHSRHARRCLRLQSVKVHRGPSANDFNALFLRFWLEE
jgi:hypothetical protein